MRPIISVLATALAAAALLAALLVGAPAPLPIDPEYYTPPQAARVLGLSRRRVTQMLSEGLLEGEKSASGRWRIPAANIDALLKARSKQSAPPPRRSSVDKTAEEIKERAVFLQGRVEQITDTLLRLFERLDRLEDRLREIEKQQTRRSG